MRDLPLALQLAKKAADDAGGKSPFYVECYASALAESGKAAEALQFAKKALETDQSSRSFETYALALAQSGKPAEAIEWQKKAIAKTGCDNPNLDLMEMTLHDYEAAAQKNQ